MRRFGFASVAALLLALGLSSGATAQLSPGQTADGSARALNLAPDSPFRDPDLIYLEADEVINNENTQVLTAIGEVEGRYEDRTLRANRVDYDLNTGVVLATGDVVLIDSTGDVQYADKLELSSELQTGTAANFTARLATGATTAARFVTRDEDGEFELFNVTYTACELCRESDGDAKRPTWRLRARRVKQDVDTRTIRYKDAVLEVFGIPVFYTPYLAHPDPSQDRSSGLLFPTFGFSRARGMTYTQPYYWAVDDYSELTITPRLYSKVNPLLSLQGRRKFATGEITMRGSATYETAFDNDGDALDDPSLFIDPTQAEDGPEFSGHLFADGYFKPSESWHYGYTFMHQTDDNYLARYGLPLSFQTSGLYEQEFGLNTKQAFLAGQGDNYRLTMLAAGFQSARGVLIRDAATGLLLRIDDNGDRLPIIAPKIQGEYIVRDPLAGGRMRLFGDVTYLTRKEGNDYGRATVGADYSKTWIAPGGIEVKPFAWGRFDNYELTPNSGENVGFSRSLGQGGVDIRYPFIRPGKSVSLIVEPRAQLTQSFGDAKIERFIDPVTGGSILEDGGSPDLDSALLFEPNKSDGFDFFENGRRIDVGASVAAQFRMLSRDSEVSLFGGRSYASDVSNAFGIGSGLRSDSSDWIGEVKADLGGVLTARSLVRYDDDRGEITRVDADAGLRLGKLYGYGRYYFLNDLEGLGLPTFAPDQELSGGLTFGPIKNWSVGYSASIDLDEKVIRAQRSTLRYTDDCTLLELYISTQDSNNVVLNDTEIGITLQLKSLGGF